MHKTLSALCPKMSEGSMDSETLLRRLSHRPRGLLDSMITISDPPKPSAPLQTGDRLSSLGVLDGLPTELLLEVLNMLDVRSLTRFLRVSHRANLILRSLPSYRQLLNHAPDALAALSRTNLIRLFSMSELHAVLQTQHCATCSNYGAFLFLPTCERCCWQCLQSRRERLVVPPAVAAKALALTQEEINRLPLISSIPGRYGVRRLLLDTPHKLVSVKAAMELAISTYGSAERVWETLSHQNITGSAAHTARFLQRMLLEDDEFNTVLVPFRGTNIVGRYFGMASIPFPSLARADIAERGLWCRGCSWMYDHRYLLPGYVVDQAVLAEQDPESAQLRMARKAYSIRGLLEHVQDCYGAQRLIAKSAEDDGADAVAFG
ncbi:hypothetical protein diail_7507 [Diaporthe ilicicola]|nr:hypothetical protein diail_7507 [Diaporthe ilicicola]